MDGQRNARQPAQADFNNCLLTGLVDLSTSFRGCWFNSVVFLIHLPELTALIRILVFAHLFSSVSSSSSSSSCLFVFFVSLFFLSRAEKKPRAT
ncbi:hypothetical protein TRV_01389 [Trichophyton verrucosum HKI 0517]|uniref:Transmembrane protein n=1 Tax=Trichophyton verrucosum (strain HKI 0517) TaxID=663202 RepID=D4D2T3_TRIVH|nr:uncharacterized protein TRV_01389 [Trichophyton verrucosum HKI 0517]EFE43815.1 hypothetical protein TRV_01389 [Trichophyton verrucosum HKI 0517]